MSASLQESIKHLTKSESKTELTKRGLPSNGRKDDLLKRLTETLNEQSNKVDETEKQLQNMSIETIKAIVRHILCLFYLKRQNKIKVVLNNKITTLVLFLNIP